MKEPSFVAEAAAAVAAAESAVAAAESAVVARRADLSATRAAYREALERADRGLPKCALVTLSYRTDKIASAAPMVILRRTPGGLLVVRHAGMRGSESRFEWSAMRGAYVEKRAHGRGFPMAAIELRDVPDEYMPKGREA